jgi:hypothetical protein
MNVENLARGLTYKGAAEGKRQTYYIFEGHGFYLNLNFKKADPNAGNFHVVDSEAVEYMLGKFAGASGVTAQDVFDRTHTTRYARHVSSNLDALNILYVLVGLGHAHVDKRHKEKSLYFNIK